MIPRLWGHCEFTYIAEPLPDATQPYVRALLFATIAMIGSTDLRGLWNPEKLRERWSDSSNLRRRKLEVVDAFRGSVSQEVIRGWLCRYNDYLRPSRWSGESYGLRERGHYCAPIFPRHTRRAASYWAFLTAGCHLA